MTQEKMSPIISHSELEALREEHIKNEQDNTKLKRIWLTFKKQKAIFLMLLPVIIFFILFRYRPILELITAFKKNEIALGKDYFVSQWYGFFPLKELMFTGGENALEFWRAFRNTFTISMYGLIFGFPVPIILALLFSEIKSEGYRSITQILTYLPKFLSTVVITSLLFLMLREGEVRDGVVIVQSGFLTRVLEAIKLIPPNTNMLGKAEYFRSIYILSDIWEGAGYGSIVYFAAIMAISPTQYEAARIDGANKLAQIRHVTLPGMAPTLIIMLILRIGNILTVGYEKIVLLTLTQKDRTVLNTAEVLSSYILRITNTGPYAEAGAGGISAFKDYVEAVATSADLFNSLIAMFLVLGANFISRRVSETSLF